MGAMKVGVLVLAYNAESTIASVLDRFPDAMRDEIAEVLVLDDHSADHTLQVAEAYRDAHPELTITVQRQPRNLGYGGNQKSGYFYAIEHAWDVVVMVHGDGQYAPECLGDMIAPIIEGRADAVFGSRMMDRSAARRGGMPLYKLLGNRVLTSCQNWLAGMELTEWHSGYRAYRTDALAELALEANSDGFDFDTEIILQFHAAGRRIVEIPIPTYYGDEVCYVNGLAYARDIMVHALRYRLGARGFGQGQLGNVGEFYAYKPDAIGSHGRILAMMQDEPPRRVLDVGCGPGWLAGPLRECGHEVVGVDLVEHAGVRSRTDRFVRADLDAGIPDEVGVGYDVILAADVLEHMRNPERLLRQMTERLRDGGVVLASVPNISHWYSRGRIALGLFSYDQRGILDRTHVRFFTRRSFLQLARRCGLQPGLTRHTGIPFDAVGLGGRTGLLGRFVCRVDSALVRAWPTMFAYQFVFELLPKLDASGLFMDGPSLNLTAVADLRDQPSAAEHRRTRRGTRVPKHGRRLSV
jgi:glycosyltransferase involved in cell wall biosynthesis